jgi:ribosomal protein L20A (L18A)|tara:strand:- start:79 stop:348 length:270 start_codon:yes stop_codon:yes gene_type:complete
MKAYRVSGIAPFGSMRQKFSLDFAAENKEDAEHQAYSALGSRHKAKRRTIKIESTIEIDPRTSTEARILHEFREHIAASGGPIVESEEE